MSQSIWMSAVIDLAVFLELSTDDVVQDDAAVQQLDTLAQKLQGLSLEELAKFEVCCSRRADEEERTYGRTPRTEFVRDLPEALGLRN